jgi:glyoxylase-like metal-dependent hydrolase (beta-lactamase superfamily II)
VEDFLGLGMDPKVMFPAFEPGMVQAEREWLVPTFFNPEENRLRTSIHSWVVCTGRHTVLIDCCVGNGKQRRIPHFHMRNEPWLERLRAVGVNPEQVDYVMCTHLHSDHVGWNTRLENGRWVPTFPRARYVFGRTEFQRWDVRSPGYQGPPHNDFVFEDSILPVVESGQAVLVDDGYAVDDMLVVESAPGHTRGHARIRLRSRQSEGIFAGDILHHPLQIPYPELCSAFDDDPQTGLQTRIKLLADCAERDLVMMPAHFAEPHCCRIVGRSGKFEAKWD